MEGILRLDSLRIPLRQVRYLYLATVYVLTSDPPPSGLLSILGPRSCPYNPTCILYFIITIYSQIPMKTRRYSSAGIETRGCRWNIPMDGTNAGMSSGAQKTRRYVTG